MHYTEHPDYHLYKSQIDQLLKDGFPKKTYARNLVRNHYIEQPKIKLTGQYSIKEREFKDIIGKKKGLLTVIGFVTDGTLSPKLNPIVCQCDCGAYCIIKASNFQKENLILACSECVLTQNGFSRQFWEINRVNLADNVVCSIFGGENLSIVNFTDPARTYVGSINTLEKLSIDELKLLTYQYNAYSIEHFALSEDKNQLVSPKIFEGGIRKNLVNCYVHRPELINLEDVPAKLHNRNISQMIGVRIDRYEVVGILKTEDIYDYSTNKATLVARCECGMYSLFNYKTLHKPQETQYYSCNRCQCVENEIIRREFEKHGELVTAEKAWKILGYVAPTKVVFKKALNTDVRNAYTHEINRLDKDKVPAYHKKYFGMRFGYVVIVDRARRKDVSGNADAFAVASCDCGQECYFPYRKLKLNTDSPVVLACSECSYQINKTFHWGGNNGQLMGRPSTVFKKVWSHYLYLFGYDRELEFSPIWRAYLLMKKNNPELIFKQIVNTLIEAAMRFKEKNGTIEQIKKNDRDVATKR